MEIIGNVICIYILFFSSFSLSLSLSLSFSLSLFLFLFVSLRFFSSFDEILQLLSRKKKKENRPRKDGTKIYLEFDIHA